MPAGGLEVLLKAERGEIDPLTITADQYDLVCNGVELSSGAVRNHDPEIMIKMCIRDRSFYLGNSTGIRADPSGVFVGGD